MVGDTIGTATADCTATFYGVTYDGSSHTATGSCTGASGVNLPSGDLDLSDTSHANVGDYADAWSFNHVSGNYADPSGTVNDSIGQAIANYTTRGVLDGS